MDHRVKVKPGGDEKKWPVEPLRPRNPSRLGALRRAPQGDGKRDLRGFVLTVADGSSPKRAR